MNETHGNRSVITNLKRPRYLIVGVSFIIVALLIVSRFYPPNHDKYDMLDVIDAVLIYDSIDEKFRIAKFIVHMTEGTIKIQQKSVTTEESDMASNLEQLSLLENELTDINNAIVNTRDEFKKELKELKKTAPDWKVASIEKMQADQLQDYRDDAKYKRGDISRQRETIERIRKYLVKYRLMLNYYQNHIRYWRGELEVLDVHAGDAIQELNQIKQALSRESVPVELSESEPPIASRLWDLPFALNFDDIPPMSAVLDTTRESYEEMKNDGMSDAEVLRTYALAVQTIENRTLPKLTELRSEIRQVLALIPSELDNQYTTTLAAIKRDPASNYAYQHLLAEGQWEEIEEDAELLRLLRDTDPWLAVNP